MMSNPIHIVLIHSWKLRLQGEAVIRKWACLILAALFCIGGTDTAMALSLSDRYIGLRCAIVQIETANGTGTGFFVDGDGTILTAAHVVYIRTFNKNGTTVTFNAQPISKLKIHTMNGTTSVIELPVLNAVESQESLTDLARISSGLKPPCFLHTKPAKGIKIGAHVIAIGFPALSPSSGVLYDGFISAFYQTMQVPVGNITGSSNTVNNPMTMIRVQMPITKGASGSPLITDDGAVVGVISEIPLFWTQELTRLIQTYGANGAKSGLTLDGFDMTKLLADLALTVSEFESPGAAFAIPIDYLESSIPKVEHRTR
jgi:hypothetical protein